MTIIANIKDKEEDKITNIMGVLDNPAIVEEGDSNKSILVRGLDLSKENDIYDLTNKISEGKFPENENEVLIGKGISEDLNLKVDDELVFSSPSIGEKKVKVTGIVDLKVKGMNDSWVITTLT